MPRFIKDSALIKSQFLPAAGAAAAVTPGIDLGTAVPFPSNELFSVKLSIPATATLVSGKSITISFEHSVDNINFLAIPELDTLVVTGIEGNTSAAVERNVMLPPAIKQYIRASASVETGGGNSTGTEFTMELLF